MNRTLAAIIAGLMILSGIAIASGAPGGAETTEISSERGTGTGSQTADLQGGNVSLVNISGNQITGRWGGFFGNVSGGILLSDNGGQLFYEWTVTNYDGAVVYAASGAISDWSDTNIIPADETHQPAYLVGAFADNFTNTFDDDDTFTSASLSIPSTLYADTYDDGGADAWRTWALYATTETAYIYAGDVEDSGTAFDGSTVNYQLLAPADSGIETYQFYLELP